MGLDLQGQPLPDQYWEFKLVVDHPYENLYVERRADGLHNIHGTQPRGFTARLTTGDKVYWKPHGRTWLLKFRLAFYRGRECLRYGEVYGPHPDEWRVLENLPRSAFANAGIIPDVKRTRHPRRKRWGKQRTRRNV